MSESPVAALHPGQCNPFHPIAGQIGKLVSVFTLLLWNLPREIILSVQSVNISIELRAIPII